VVVTPHEGEVHRRQCVVQKPVRSVPGNNKVPNKYRFSLRGSLLDGVRDKEL
jgi:hypothetical protein